MNETKTTLPNLVQEIIIVCIFDATYLDGEYTDMTPLTNFLNYSLHLTIYR